MLEFRFQFDDEKEERSFLLDQSAEQALGAQGQRSFHGGVDGAPERGPQLVRHVVHRLHRIGVEHDDPPMVGFVDVRDFARFDLGGDHRVDGAVVFIRQWNDRIIDLQHAALGDR